MSTRNFTGYMPDGTRVLVTVFGDTAELAFREGEGSWGHWGLPVELSEEQPC